MTSTTSPLLRQLISSWITIKQLAEVIEVMTPELCDLKGVTSHVPCGVFVMVAR